MLKTHHQISLNDKAYPVHYLTNSAIAGFTATHLINSPCELLGLDIETSKHPKYVAHKYAGLNPFLSKIRLVQIFDGSAVYIFDLHHYSIELLRNLFSHKRFVAYNALFELQHLFHALKIMPNIGCAFLMYKIMHQATNEENRAQKFGLLHAVKAILYFDIDKEQQQSDWSVETLTEKQLSYAAIDAIVPTLLATRLAGMLKQHDMLDIYNLNKKAQYPLTEMSLNGMLLNTEAHQQLISSWELQRRSAELEVRVRVGEINLNSTKQLSDWALNESGLSWKTWPRSPKTKHLKFDKKTLTERGGLPFVEELITYKTYQKLLSTYGEKFAQFISPITGRIHPNFTLCQTETGRLSCRTPNLQNQPRTANMRALFVARPDCKLIVADYSQIELRCAAEISRDSTMLAAYRDGLDLHRITASNLSGCKFEDVTKDQRQMAKAVNFGLLFGSGAKKLREQAKQSYGIDLTLAEAQQAVQTFRETYPEYRAWQVRQAQQTEQTMRVTTPLGKIRRLSTMGYYTRSMNTPIQGAAAEVMLLALINLYNTKPDYMHILNCVHDEIMLEAPEEHAIEAQAVLEKAMLNAWVMVFPEASTRDLVDCSIGNNWSEAK